MADSDNFGTVPGDRPLDPDQFGSAAAEHTPAPQMEAEQIPALLPPSWNQGWTGTLGSILSAGLGDLQYLNLTPDVPSPSRGDAPAIEAAVKYLRHQEKEAEVPPAAPWCPYIPLREIGLGLPLSIEILSIFPGDAWKEGRGGRQLSLLVTSSVKDPTLFDAAPLAMNYYFPQVMPGKLLHPAPDQPGSSVVYYSPGVVSDSLQIQLSMYFDPGHKAKAARWADVAKKAGRLPIFTVLPEAKMAGTIIYAAGAALQFANSIFDDIFRGPPPWKASWTLNMNEPGLARAEAAYMLFCEDGSSNVVPGPPGLFGGELEFGMRGKMYVVSVDDGTLRYRDAPDERVLDGGPYILVRLHGTEREGLSHWAPVAVSPDLYQRFVSAKGRAGGDKELLEVLKAYNDMVMVKKAMSIAECLQNTVSIEWPEGAQVIWTYPSPYEDKQSKLRGALNNIQDRDLRELVRKAISP